MQNEEVTSDEKLMAMLSHLSILFGGIILPIILWAVQKDKSKFIRYHALQAIFFHLVYLAVIVIATFAIVFFAIAFGLGLGSMSHGHHHSGSGPMPVIMIIMMFVAYAAFFLSIFGAIGYEVFLAIKSYQGSYIKIPVIGKIIYKKVYGE
jgi:uncharacterized protein